MRVPIVVPELGTCDEPLCVSGWLVDEGEFVVAGDLIVEVRIPGLTFDLMAESTGRLVEISKPVESSIRTGEILGWLDDSAYDVEETDNIVPADP